MKKLVGVIISIFVILAVLLLGYKFVYKISPRLFINKDTKLIYANEGITTKDFKELSQFIANKEKRKKFEKNIKPLNKYITKIYAFSDDDIQRLKENDIVFVIDPGYFYPFALKELDKYYESYRDGILIEKENVSGYFLPENKKTYLKPHRGLFIVGFKPEVIKKFVSKEDQYTYYKDIENSIDENRDNLLGTLIYTGPEIEEFGVKFTTLTGNVVKNKLKFQQVTVLNENSVGRYKNTKENRELLQYVGKNDLYLSLDDFSNLDVLIFNPYVLGYNFDKESMFEFWKAIFGIDIKLMLKEVDGEAIIRSTENGAGAMVKIKEDSKEIRKVLGLLQSENGFLDMSNEIQIKDNNTVILGTNEFKKQEKEYNIPKEAFIFGDMDFSKFLNLPDLDITFIGNGNKITTDIEMSADTVKEIQKRY